MAFAVIAVVVLACAVLILTVKIFLMRKSAEEITKQLAEKISSDTNTLIDISSNDLCMRSLASEINAQLLQLRYERQRYVRGDLELKEDIANISHDLRTPLTALNGYLELLCHIEKSDEAERYITQIKNRVDALSSLTDELFDYSIVASLHGVNLERMDLVRATEDVLISFYAMMKEKGIDVRIDFSENPVWCLLDCYAVNRIFSNIISNVVKYSQSDLHVQLTSDGQVKFVNRAESLSEIDVLKLFDRYYTVNSAKNSTGIGLSIAKLLTERLGGKILAEYIDGELIISLDFSKSVQE